MNATSDVEQRDRWSGRQILCALQGPYSREQSDRRAAKRAAIVTALTIWICDTEPQLTPLEPLHTLSTDVSETGLSFLSRSFVMPATPLQIAFDNIPASPPIRALSLSCVKAGGDYFRVGAQFVGATGRLRGGEA